jgi:hypothetical protein
MELAAGPIKDENLFACLQPQDIARVSSLFRA